MHVLKGFACNTATIIKRVHLTVYGKNIFTMVLKINMRQA